MELNESRLQALESLVDELLKGSPEPKKIKNYFSKAGIPDPIDPVARIQSVLGALRFETPKGTFDEE